MDLKIFDFEFLEMFEDAPFNAGSAIIFIDSTGEGAVADLNLKIDPQNLLKIDLLVLDFSEGRMTAFSSGHADQIADFLKAHEDDIDTLFCVCSTGTTFSGGVAAAIREYYSHDGIEIFKDPDYKPEVGAFHLVLEALQGKLPSEEEDDVFDKQEKNLEVQVSDLSSIQELAAEPFKKKTALIRVCDDECNGELDLKNSPNYFLEINMDEVYVGDDSYEEDGEEDDESLVPVFDCRQAEQIADFVRQHKDDVDVVTCQGFEYATVDYSRAIAAAITEFYNHDGIEIFKRYHLHTGVFQMMYEALTGDIYDDFVYL